MEQFAVSPNGQLADASVLSTVAKLRQQFPWMSEAPIVAHMTLQRAHHVYAAALTARHKDLDLSISHFGLLQLLYCHEGKPLTVSEIGIQRRVSVPNVLQLLEVLEAKNWLKRTRTGSGRASYVELTEEGRERLAALLPQAIESWSELWSGFTDDELETLTHLLAKLRMNLLSRYFDPRGLMAYRSAERRRVSRNARSRRSS